MITTAQEIKPEKDDAPEFIESINKILGTMIFQYRLKEIVIIKIKNWFDHKWLNYSGKAVVPFDFMDLPEFDKAGNTALEAQWRDEITIPPFHPNRVISNEYFFKEETGNERIRYVLHRFKNSNENIHNRIKDTFTDGIAIWYSSHTKTNQRGSLMAYRIQDNEVNSLYATIENRNGWKITATKGIGLNELKAYLD